MKMTFAVTIAGAFIVFLAVVMAVVFIPGLIWQPPETIIAHPYTPEEERGRIIFYANGCNYCHTQYVRYYDTGLGPISEGGNYIYDQPMILGSERTGPDLSYIGRKRSEAWEIQHWKDPRSLSPMSIMPVFDFLSDQQLSDLAAYVNNLGDRTVGKMMILPPLTYATSSNPIEIPEVMLTSSDMGWQTWTDSGLQDGKITYITRCQTCHGDAGNGLGAYAGTKVVTPANYKVPPFNGMPDDQWFWHVSEGVQGSVMPPWKASLTEDERWKVINYIKQIFAHPFEHDPQEGDPTGEYVGVTNPLPITVENLQEGKALFTRECWVCHGDAGKGEGVYRAGLYPIPPDFSALADYADWSDADYYWRISEGVPWSAMPIWKEILTEDQRWQLVHFIRVNFTQTETRPESAPEQVYPTSYLVAVMPTSVPIEDVLADGLTSPFPVTPSWGMGRAMYLQMCAHCHGLTGLGDGWDGTYLDVAPANFHDPDVRGFSDGDWFSRVSFGIQNSAMPVWGEWMPIEYRWNVIKFLQESIVATSPSETPAPVPSAYKGKVAADFATMARGIFEDEVGPISSSDGGALYAQYCEACHGPNGQGEGPDVNQVGIAAPSPFPTNMSEQYIYWRIAEGVPETFMYPFKTILDQTQIWDLTAYMTDQGWGQTSYTPVMAANTEIGGE